jgi:hypothetical protein
MLIPYQPVRSVAGITQLLSMKAQTKHHLHSDVLLEIGEVTITTRSRAYLCRKIERLQPVTIAGLPRIA